MKRWLMDTAHISHFIVVLLTGFIMGVLASSWCGGLVSAPTAIMVSFLLICMSLVKRRNLMLVAMLSAGVMLGLARGGTEQAGLKQYQSYIAKTALVSGVVAEDPSIGKANEVHVKLRNVTLQDARLGGELWVSLPENVSVQRSDTIRVEGTISAGFGNFAAAMYRANVVSIEATSEDDIGLRMRDTFATLVDKGLDSPNLELGLGYLLGLKSALPETLSGQIQLLGLTHVVVASGYNLTILVSFARRLLARFSKYLAAMSGGAMIIGFMAITGLSPSMSRAGLVAGLSLLAWYYGRKIHPVSLLIIAAACTLAYRPSYIWGDIGWYLSFAAFFGILVLAPLLHHYFWGEELRPSLLRELLVATTAAQVMTMPIILATFGTVSLLSLPANVLILPFVPLAMLATFIAGVCAALMPVMAGVFAWPAYFLLSYSVAVVDTVSSVPTGQIELSISSLHVVGMYAVLLLVVLLLKRVTQHNFMKDKIIVE